MRPSSSIGCILREPEREKDERCERKDDDGLSEHRQRAGSSAVRRPDAWSHVITAAVPLRIAALHVSRRRLIQPGGDGSTITIWRST